MHKEIADKWTAALRSGEYAQGTGCLKRVEDGVEQYCCLGVLSNLFLEENPTAGEWRSGGWMGRTVFYSGTDPEPEDSVLPIRVMTWAGVKTMTGNLDNEDGTPNALTDMNDSGNFTFEQIADMIEARYEEL